MIIELNNYLNGTISIYAPMDPEVKFIVKAPEQSEIDESDLVYIRVWLRKAARETELKHNWLKKRQMKGNKNDSIV